MADPSDIDPSVYEHRRVTLPASRGSRTYDVVVQEPLSDTFGTNAPTILLLHGYPDLWYGWRYQIRAFARRGFRVVVPSQLGYGDTDKPDDPRQYSFRSTALDNDAIMRELGVSGKYLVGGHAVSWRLCQYCPDRVLAVAVICTPWFAPTPADREWMELEVVVDNFLPNFGYQLSLADRDFIPVLDRNVDIFLGSTHARRAQDSASRTLAKGVTDEQVEAMSAWSRKGVLEQGLREADEARRNGTLEGPQPTDDIELRTYLEIFRKGGMMAPTNWYRNHRANFDEEKAHPVPAHHPQHIPALFFPADHDYALPPWMSMGMKKSFPGSLEVVPLNTTHWAMTDVNARDGLTAKMLEFFTQHQQSKL